jgi:hypothetical protein
MVGVLQPDDLEDITVLCLARRCVRSFAEIKFPLASFGQPAKTPKNRPWQCEILDISSWTTHLHIITRADCHYRNTRTT